MKRLELKEQKLVVLKTIRLGNWKLATIIDVIDEGMEIDESTEEAVLIKVESNPKKKRQLRTLKKKYLDVIKEATNPEAVFREVIRQLVTIKLQDLLVCSPTFAKLLFQGVPV
jgi:hypothetical protein